MRRSVTFVRRAALAAVLGALQWPAPAEAQTRTVSWSRQSGGEDEMRVHVSFGAGELRLRRAEPGRLYRARLDYDESAFAPEHDYDDGELEIGIKGLHKDKSAFRLGGSGRRGEAGRGSSLDLWLSPDVPQSLELDFGAGTADADLSGIPLRRLEINTGASESSIRVDEPNPVEMARAEVSVGAAELSIQGLGNLRAEHVVVQAGLGSVTLGIDGDWPNDARLEIEMGLGALTIEAPASLGVRIRRQSILVAVQADGFEQEGRTHISANWDSADRRVDIELQAALGSVEVVRIR